MVIVGVPFLASVKLTGWGSEPSHLHALKPSVCPCPFLLGSLEVDLLTKELEDFEMKKAAARAVTGVLASHPNSTDAHIINLSLTFHGQELLSDTKLELNSGRRYGLIGLNGIGKGLPGVGWGREMRHRVGWC